MSRPVVSCLAVARTVVALLTRLNTLPVAPWLSAPIIVLVRGRKGIGGARRRIRSPRVVPQLNVPRVLDRSSGVSAAIARILGVSLRTVAGRSRVRTMARVCRGGAITIIGPAVRVCIGPPAAIGAPIARIAEIVGRPSALAAAVSSDVRPHHRAATAGGCTPPAGAVRSHTARTKSVKLTVPGKEVSTRAVELRTSTSHARVQQGSPADRAKMAIRRSRPARAIWVKDRCTMGPNDRQRDTKQGLPPRHPSRLSHSARAR
jgi:hypothetical protein